MTTTGRIIGSVLAMAILVFVAISTFISQHKPERFKDANGPCARSQKVEVNGQFVCPDPSIKATTVAVQPAGVESAADVEPPKLSAAERRAQEAEARRQAREQQAELKRTQAALRKEFATQMQHELWLKGYDCTFEARGTTLYLEYVFIGRPEAYQMQKLIIEPQYSKLVGMGFTKVVISNGYDHEYSWKL